MSRRVVILARHFPPLISGGARRPFLLAKRLLAEGHKVVVVSPVQSDSVPSIAVPHPAPEMAHGVSETVNPLKDRIREWLMLPDADIRWALKASRVALPFTPDWIITTSPPESLHVAGFLMKRRTGVRWIADFRDHWLAAPLLPIRRRSALRRRVEAMIARYILSRADAAIGVTDGICAEIRTFCPNMPLEKIVMAENFGPDAPSGTPPDRNPDMDRTVILHTGSFSLSDPGRRIEPVLEAFGGIIRPGLVLRLVGKLTADEIAFVKAAPFSENIEITGPCSLEDSWAEQRKADYLLLSISTDTPHIPGKLAEYRAVGRPIFVVGDTDWVRRQGLAPLSRFPNAGLDPGDGLSTGDGCDAFLDIMNGA
jgi:glycosyltransferase involved in cell wall biosynthesis